MFGAQLEKSREATDAANIRAAYSQAVSNLLSSSDATPKGESSTYNWKAQVAAWANTFDFPEGIDTTDGGPKVTVGGSYYIEASYNTDGTLKIDFKTGSASSGS